jgi:hypothetical protein
LPDPASGGVDHPEPHDDRAVRRLDDGREFTIIKVFRSPKDYEQALRLAGFADVEMSTTGRFFVLGQAVWQGGA